MTRCPCCGLDALPTFGWKCGACGYTCSTPPDWQTYEILEQHRRRRALMRRKGRR